MGALFSRRAGSDVYYANYEKAFERLEKDSSKIVDRRIKRRKAMDATSNIGFWVTAVTLSFATLLTAYLQQVHTQRWYQKSITILGAFTVPVISVLVFQGVLWFLRKREQWDEKFLRKLKDAKRKMIKDLKDSTRFDKTMELIKKYDPDEQPVPSPRAALTPAGAGGLRRRASAPLSNGQPANTTPQSRSGATTPGGLFMGPAAAAASAAVSVATETGRALMPVIGHLANNIVGDSPVLVQEAQQLRDENKRLQEKLADIEARLAASDGPTEVQAELVTEKAQVASSG